MTCSKPDVPTQDSKERVDNLWRDLEKEGDQFFRPFRQISPSTLPFVVNSLSFEAFDFFSTTGFAEYRIGENEYGPIVFTNLLETDKAIMKHKDPDSHFTLMTSKEMENFCSKMVRDFISVPMIHYVYCNYVTSIPDKMFPMFYLYSDLIMKANEKNRISRKKRKTERFITHNGRKIRVTWRGKK